MTTDSEQRSQARSCRFSQNRAQRPNLIATLVSFGRHIKIKFIMLTKVEKTIIEQETKCGRSFGQFWVNGCNFIDIGVYKYSRMCSVFASGEKLRSRRNPDFGSVESLNICPHFWADRGITSSSRARKIYFL